MRAVHLHKDISPPYSEVFRGLCRANPVRLARKGKRGKTNADYEANRCIKPKATEAGGGRRRTEGRGETEGRACAGPGALGGVAAMRMSFGQKQRAVLDRTALWK